MLGSFFTCLHLGFSRLRRRPGKLLGACLLPLSILLLGLLLPPASLDTPLEAGVCLPEASPHADALLARLRASDPRFVVFHAADEQTVCDEVAAGRWVCGFVLREDFETLVSAPAPGPLAEVVVTRAETMAPLLCEAFSAALYHVRAPMLAANYAEENSLAHGPSLDTLRERVAQGAPQAMALHTVSTHGRADQAPRLGAATARAAGEGLIAVFLFLFCLLLASELDSVRQEGWFARTAAVSGPFALRAGLTAAVFVPLTALAGLALALSEAFFASSAPKATDFAALFGYALWLGGLTLLLGQIPGVRHTLAALLPFVPAACLLLCPIFFDAARLFAPAAPFSSLLPPTWLLRALQGAGPDSALLWGLGPVSLAAAAGLSKRISP